MHHHTDFANSKDWLTENIIFSYLSFMEPIIHTVDVANLPFIHRFFIDLSDRRQIEQKEGTLKLLDGLEMELKAWDRLSDEAFANLENSK